MNEASSRFLSRATRGVRFLCRTMADTPGRRFLERVMAAHCNGSGHVPGCDKGVSNVPHFNLSSSVDEAKQKAKDYLKNLKANLAKDNKKLVNKTTGQSVKVSKYLQGEILNERNIQKSQTNLSKIGIKKNEAFRIHLEAAAHIDELFENAKHSQQTQIYHQGKKHKEKEAAWHYYAPFTVPGHKETMYADMSVMKFINADGEELYALSLSLNSHRNE